MDQRQHEQPVGAWPDPDPFVGDRRIAGAHRIYRDEFGAAPAQARQCQLDRVGIMVLGNAEHQEEAGALPIRLAEFPEAAAQRVHAGRGHVDRAETAMRGEVRGAELGRPEPGQRLALVAPGKEGELPRIVGADSPEPAECRLDRLVPLDLAELARATLADAEQRLAQPRRRIMLHDPGRALATDDAMIDRMARVTLDEADT